MALQGTLDTFALPDVLRLLATTRKTGRLLVHGNRGDGSVWVDAGAVVAAATAGLREGAAAADVIFELLRHTEGSFSFEAGSAPAEASAPIEVEPLLVGAERQLAEWREIEAVVGSLDTWVTLAPELPGSETVIDAARWRTIVAIGSGSSVRSIGETLDLGEVAASRLVKELFEVGLGALSPVEPGQEPPRELGESSFDLGPFANRSVPNLDLSIDLGTFGDEPAELAELAPAEAASNAVALRDAAKPRRARTAAADQDQAQADGDPIEADEVARQLAALSPKAARAVAAAAKAETPEEREAALANVTGEGDEPINRGLLLKFLSSVRS